ncbi:hypothetical protein ACFLUT_03045 [Chloroflexota bacterium]
MRMYRAMSLVLMLAFASTGLLFLVSPDAAIGFFNNLSSSLGMPAAPADGWDFFLILAVGYMYVVTFLAFMMFRHPDNRSYPLLLANAKLASSILSLALFMLQAHYLVYLANFAVDGVIGIVVLVTYMRMRTA